MLFHRCFRNRFSSPFHLDTLNISIQNIKCPESPKNTNIIMLPSVSLFRDPHPGISLIRGPYKNLHKCIQLFQLVYFPQIVRCNLHSQLDHTSVTGFRAKLMQRRHSSSFIKSGGGKYDVQASSGHFVF